MNISNLKTSKRMALGLGSVIILLLLVSIIAWWQLSVINRNMDSALAESAKSAKVKDINTSLDNLYLEMWGLVSSRNPVEKQDRKKDDHSQYNKFEKIFYRQDCNSPEDEDKWPESPEREPGKMNDSEITEHEQQPD